MIFFIPRWDSPLIPWYPDTDPSFASLLGPLSDRVVAAMWSGRAVKPNQATQKQSLSANNFVYQVDVVIKVSFFIFM